MANLTIIVVLSQLSALDWLGKDGWWLTWVAMAGLVWVVSRAKPIEAALYGLLMGVLSLGAAFWWAQYMLAFIMEDEGYLPKLIFAGLVVWESVLFVVFAASIASTRRREPNSVGLLIPICVWLVAEAYLPRIFVWSLAHSQLGAIPLVQTAELGGASMVSIMVLIAACLPTLLMDLLKADSTRRAAARRGLVIALTILLAYAGYGIIRVRSVEAASGKILRLGVVQEDPAYRDGIPKMRERSLPLGAVDLLVWPESTMGVHSNSLNSFGDPDHVVANSKMPIINTEPMIGLQSQLIVGGRSFDGNPSQSVPEYQTAFLMNPDGSIVQRYHKRSLMPLGEYVPGEKSWPWLHNWFKLSQYFESGKSDAPLVLAGGEKIGAIICYEDTIAEVTRQTVAAGAQLLICIINDSAFESPIALRQHLKLARLRAIENRRYLVRSAGTGVSCVVDPLGSLHHAIDANETGAFVAEVKLLDGWTPFQKLGQWPPLVAIAILAFFLVRDRLNQRAKGAVA